MGPKLVERLDLRAILLLVVIFIAVMLLWNTPVVWPLKILVVFFHETSHGLAALATGGSIQNISIMPDESGLTTTLGGSPFIISSAGYLGSLIFGAIILILASRTRWDRIITVVLGLLLLVVTVVFVPFKNAFGFIFGLVTAAALLAIAKFLPNPVSDFLLKIIGVTSCGYAILDIYDDAVVRTVPISDASALAKSTGLPAVVWGVIWIVLAVGGAALAFWIAAKGEKQIAGSAAPTGKGAGSAAS